MDKFTMKPAARAMRKQSMPAADRIAATLDDIADALETIAQELMYRK